MLGELKFNCDVLRNHKGSVVGAWTNHFYASNVFCVELEVMIQTFTQAENLKLQKFTFEGDSLNVIMALQGAPLLSGEHKGGFEFSTHGLFL